ncbi:MAG TPA: redoxin domain-containing protein [Verrucomicrobiae bacterium]|nr:redoxin domain-containing protein [Verrucomicrobiae bacterium]
MLHELLFAGATAWLNSSPLTPADLQGKVVAVEFWTYTCVNWERMLPYVRAWAAKYKNDGLVVIGVHTPEFSFEKNLDNIRRAIQGDRIDYPVAVDSDYAIWRAFDNEYWPALYLIDAQGRIRYHHFGEGAYEESETEIRKLLADAGHRINGPAFVSVDPTGLEVAVDWDNVRSAETYLGSERTTNFVSPAPEHLPLNSWAVSGDWTLGKEAVALKRADGKIVFQFHARDLNLIMGPAAAGTSVRFRVTIDGHPPGAAHGSDVDANGDGVVSEQRTYQLIRQPKPIVDRRFDIEFFGPGVEAFDVTFG